MRAFARVTGAAVFGAEAELVDVQVAFHQSEDAELQDTSFRIVGLPDSALREGRERIRTAVHHHRFRWPRGHITVNLAPAATRKQGAALDVAIAVGVLAAGGSFGPANDKGVGPGFPHILVLGELTLDGSIRPVRGVLAAAEAARRAGIRHAIVPSQNAAEAAAIEGMSAVPVQTLHEVARHLGGARVIEPVTDAGWKPVSWSGEEPPPVRGQPVALRAAWIAATGGHNLFLTGPPGSGKTLLARHIADVMAPLTYAEAIEVSRIHSVAGLLDGALVRRRPFRAPHHTTSMAGLVGGGSMPRPGEVSLAHLGVLFLDELPEFPRTTLEALRQPIEDGTLVLGRAAGRARFPSRTMLVAAANPCPCGWYGDPDRTRCRCAPSAIARYQTRVSGPLKDRFDMHLWMKAVDPRALMEGEAEPPFPAAAVDHARAAQVARAERWGLAAPWNARLAADHLPESVEPTAEALDCLVADARRARLTGRGVHRTLRVARTLADLDGEAQVAPRHVRDALSFRGES